MRFLMLIHVDESGPDEPPPPALLEAVGALRSEATGATVVDDGGLLPTSSAVRASSGGGVVTLTDGPFAEAKEVIGGFMLLEAMSYEEAADWTRRFVALHAEHWPTLSMTGELRQLA